MMRELGQLRIQEVDQATATRDSDGGMVCRVQSSTATAARVAGLLLPVERCSELRVVLRLLWGFAASEAGCRYGQLGTVSG